MQPSLHDIDILRGRSQDLPAVRSKTVRVFISSTFSDTLSERDSLIDSVFPKLKNYCREQYGLEFQYSDMRWGIPNESADNHSEVATCLNEVALCQKYSVATNFVVLLSHRYGSRPTPATIPAALYEQLQQIVQSDPNLVEDAQLLSQWYQLDTNSIPASYVLRPISSMLPDIKSNDTGQMKQAAKEWTQINNRIRTCLRQAAAQCFQQGQITSDEYDNFFISVTEKEIVNGMLSVPNANQRTLCFLREIEDIRDHLSDKNAQKYIDVCRSPDGSIHVDEEVEQLLKRLKYTRIPNVLQANNIYSYKVRWNENGINRSDHGDYITRFNDDFYSAIKEQIDRCAKSRVMIVSDPLRHEILEHAIQCKAYVTKFHGRTDVLEKLERYIKDDEENRPCIVYGASGCGKTSVMAKAATEVCKIKTPKALTWLPNRSVSIILRFLGTTPTSSTIYKTMMSISTHICKLYNLKMEVYPDALQLRYQLETQLFAQIPDNEYLIILLDSIDQLEPEAYDCQWLPSTFPRNVKCIVSAIPDHGNILQHFKSIINYDLFGSRTNADLLVHVPPFKPSAVDIVYRDWLAMKKRSLSDEQRSFINELMNEQTEILPLYMKLVFDIILNWHSYDPIDAELKKLKSVDHCIRFLFDHLAVVHNKVLFIRAICYMTACRNGISQNELEDVLSLDDDVLQNVFQHYIPPIRRLPGILWTRIRNDLDEYITEKEADDSTVIYWYHRRFIEVANSYYISKMNSVERTAIFQNVVDFFKETWKGKSKPFKVADARLASKYNLTESNGEIEANRCITSQPIEYVDVNGNVQFNKRKLNELPQFIAQLTSNLALPIAAKEIFFNYSFMRAKIICSAFNDIMNELQSLTQSSSYSLSDEAKSVKPELNMFSMLYLIVGAQLQMYPDNFPFEISSRLLSFYGIKPNITNLIDQIDRESPRTCSLIVPYNQLQPPGTGLLYSMNRHTAAVVDFDFTPDQIVAVTLSDRIVAINMQTIATVLDINLPSLDERYLNSTTLPETYSFDGTKYVKVDWASSDENDKYKRYYFLVNSLHHIYLVSAQESIKFERTSQIGYSTVEIVDKTRALGVIVEKNSNQVECWDVVRNRLFDRIEFPKSTIKTVLCTEAYSMIIVVLHDGTIRFYSASDTTKSSFAHRGTIKLSPQVDLIVVDDDMLIITFDATASVDIAFIGLKQFGETTEPLSDEQVCKALIAFDPRMEPKPITAIILPNRETINGEKMKLNHPLFVAKTRDCAFVVHKCIGNDISYIRIDGRFDIVSIHAKDPSTLHTARGGTIDIHKWKHVECDDASKNTHKYQLYVSIDISSSPVTAIRAASDNALLFLCSMENGVIQAYMAKQSREAFKSIPMLPRTNEVIRSVQLLEKTAVTLDDAKRELTTWSYQNFTSIESTRYFQDRITIEQFALVPSSIQTDIIFVLILTNNHWIEIYSSTALKDEPLFTFHLRSKARIHSTPTGAFFVITTNGRVFSIVQRTLSHQQIQFEQSTNSQLNIPCSMMLSAVLTINQIECLIVMADNGQSMAIHFNEQIVYADVRGASSKLESITSDPTHNLLLLYYSDRTLISAQINLHESNTKASLTLTPFDRADKFCMRQHCLATYNNGTTELNLHNIHTRQCFEPIRLENECENLCLNASGAYAFALVKPRVLYMYRIRDRRQMAKLFMYDFVTFMTADNDFVVLAMNDRRLLTLMIADPDDPTLYSRIKALPSRHAQRISKSATAKMVEHMEKCAERDSSDDEDSDADEENSQTANQSTNMGGPSVAAQKFALPKSSFRFVTRFDRRFTKSKMRADDEIRLAFMRSYENGLGCNDCTGMVDNSDAENDDSEDVVFPQVTLRSDMQEHVDDDFDNIRKKTLEYNKNQLDGIQFANAGNNVKIVNSHAITSQTCTIA